MQNGTNFDVSLVYLNSLKMRVLVVILCGVLLLGCKTSGNMVATEAQKKALTTMMEKDSYVISSKLAFPTDGIITLANTGLLPRDSNQSSINLLNSPNHIIKSGDSLSVDLPYFGVRRMGDGYPDENSITFDGVPVKYKASYEEKKQRYRIFFRIQNKQEYLNVTMYVFPNLTSEVRIVSTHRSPINYRGNIKAEI